MYTCPAHKIVYVARLPALGEPTYVLSHHLDLCSFGQGRVGAPSRQPISGRGCPTLLPLPSRHQHIAQPMIGSKRTLTSTLGIKYLLAGSGPLLVTLAAASLAELDHQVDFCIQDSPRRGHWIAAQGGTNAAKNYPSDGDSVDRVPYDTIKGGDFRSRDANVHRLAQVSNSIIDQCVAQGGPFVGGAGGLLDTRSLGGFQVSRTFYARGQTGQQLLVGANQALQRQLASGRVSMHADYFGAALKGA